MTWPVRTLCIVVAAGVLITACGDNSEGNIDIRSSLDALTESGVPGALVMVTRDGTTTTIASGSSSAAVFSPVTPTATTRIASVSKAFNAATVLDLVNSEALQLSSTIGEFLPELPSSWHPVNVAQLLQHTSGLPDYIKSPKFLDDFIADPQMQRTPLELLGYVTGEPLEFPPGTEYSYSDSDNIVAGLIVEAVSAAPYDEQLAKQVLVPWGLSATSLPNSSSLPTPAILGYAVDDSGDDAPTDPPTADLIDVTYLINPSLAWASGGMISTAADLDRFIRRYAAGGDLTPELLEAQRQFVVGDSGPPGPGVNESGLGIYSYTTSCGEFLGHTGNMPGYTVFAAASPDGAYSAVLIANRQVNPSIDPSLYSAFIDAAQTALCAGRS